MLHFPGYYVGFFRYFRYFRCFLIAPDGCLSGKTAFVKVRGVDFVLISWHSCSFFTDLFSQQFAGIARFAVFFDSAYLAV